MSSKRKEAEKKNRPNPLTSLFRTLQEKARPPKASDSGSSANANRQHGGRNPQGSIDVGASANFRAQQFLTCQEDPSSSAPPRPNHQSSPPLSTQSQHTYLSSSVNSGSQTLHVQNHGNNSCLNVGNDNRGNIGIIGHNAFNLLVQQFYVSFQAREHSTSIKFSSMITAVIFIEATQQILCALFGIENATEYTKHDGLERTIVEGIFRRLIKSIKSVMERGDSSIQQTLRDYLKDLWSELCREREQLSNPNNQSVDIEALSHDIAWILRLFLFVSHMGGYIPPAILVEGLKKRMVKLFKDAEVAAPREFIKELPRARTAYDEYVSSHQRRVSCFEGTRQALLEEMGCWVSKAETGIFVLFGLAGIGKSTIAQTVAERADNVRLLGASFFFSRDDAERRTAEKFFTTIASQLRVHDPEFASAIQSVLVTEQGKDAIAKYPLDQLETFILEPLRVLTPRKVVIVVDALDECDAKDIPAVLMGLNKLVKVLPSFKVVLTTRPQRHLQLLRNRLESEQVFDLHDIENKIVDGDIECYLRHKLSLEEVTASLPNLRDPWTASDDEIKSLVCAAGRLFIIASTAVLFILDETSTPACRMALLLNALEKDHTPFKALNNFYTTILRSAVPTGCEDDTRDRYQMIIGTIILIQQPLTVSALAKLIDVEVNGISAVLGNLQPVILLGRDDIPLAYHKSFPDYIQDPARCKDEDIRIDPGWHHTRMAKHCLRLLNRCLKQNILDLSDPARFMENGEALMTQGLTENHLQDKIPRELQYACLYFADHIHNADIKDTELVEELEIFFNQRFLNWLEALSWIGKSDSAHYTLLTVQKQLKPISYDLQQLVADGLRFVWKFYQLIGHSALHIYHSALPVAPTKTRLYERYAKEMTFCQVSGGRDRWDELITTLESGFFTPVMHVAFSLDGTMFACCTDAGQERNVLITIHDAVAGINLGRIETRKFTIANDFSKAAAFYDSSITLYNVKGFTPVATIKLSATVVKLLLSPDGSRLFAGLADSTICLWDTEKCKQIEGFAQKRGCIVNFSSDGSRALMISCDGIVKLLDGTSGKVVADLEMRGLELSPLVFSRDGLRIACLSANSLRVWNSRDGALIGTAENAGNTMAMSTDGSQLVTGIQEEHNLKFFSGNDLALLHTLDVDFPILTFAMRNDLIGVTAYRRGLVALYDINSRACIAQLSFFGPTSIAFSPDCTRLVVGNEDGNVRLWDVQNIASSNASSKERLTRHCTGLAFSPDCSCLASGHYDGTIKLWDTTNMAEITPSPHMRHSKPVDPLVFSADGEALVSGSEDGPIKLWSSKNGAPSGALQCPGRILAMALSSTVLASATIHIVTLWDLKSRSLTATLDQRRTTLLTFSHHNSLLAMVHDTHLTLCDGTKHKLITTFELSSNGARRMSFLPGDSGLCVQGYNDDFYLFNIHDGEVFQSDVSAHQDISRLALFTLWDGIPVWSQGSGTIVGKFPQQLATEDPVTVFTCASDFHIRSAAEGSSMIALGCRDGRVLLIKAL